MFKPKWGIIAGLIALILALSTSLLVGHTSFPTAIIRAGIFAALFFILGTGAYTLINHFLPDLLLPGAVQEPISNPLMSNESMGTRVNITLADTSNAALPGKNTEMHSIENLDNINDLMSGAINPAAEAKKAKDVDQSDFSGYTEDIVELAPLDSFDTASDFTTELDSSIGGADKSDNFSFSFDDFIPSSTGIAELDSMDMFSLDTDSREEAEPITPARSSRKSSKNQSTAFSEEDFDPKEIASGVRTVLERDKKG